MNSKKKKIILYIISIAIILTVVAIDLISKHFTTDYSETKNIIPYIINFKSSQNTGAAWSIFSGSVIALSVITFLAIALIIIYAIFSKSNSALFFVSLSLILGGAIGNLIDRLILGYVRDFIQFDFWQTFPIFNLADTFLTIGIFCLILYHLILLIKEKRKK